MWLGWGCGSDVNRREIRLGTGLSLLSEHLLLEEEQDVEVEEDSEDELELHSRSLLLVSRMEGAHEEVTESSLSSWSRGS